ncbi:hypothetical protein ACFOD9_07000 [Novosphingobium bradum]|uniref:DUF4864 domain-containing protein n=1 Tax=Novosphingobium bradum TaxID=1737444 RepID=A0ABV7IMX9_9SPHN
MKAASTFLIFLAAGALAQPAFGQAKPVNTGAKSGASSAQPASGAKAGANAPASQQAASAQSGPDSATLLILIRSALETLNGANATNNYSVLYALGSPTFQKANSPQALSQNFAPFRQNGISLYPALVLGPRLKQNPIFDGSRIRLIGVIPSNPSNITFDIQYERVDNSWKISILTVGVTKPN